MDFRRPGIRMVNVCGVTGDPTDEQILQVTDRGVRESDLLLNPQYVIKRSGTTSPNLHLFISVAVNINCSNNFDVISFIVIWNMKAWYVDLLWTDPLIQYMLSGISCITIRMLIKCHQKHKYDLVVFDFEQEL